MKGFLITFEGIDGSGKSTQARLLKEYLLSEGYKVQLLREPGGTEIGERIRSVLLDKTHADMSHHAELFLYLAARAQITSQIIVPALDRGELVIMDRFMDSTTAYQGYARGLGMDEMKSLNFTATGGLVPNITFFVDCDPALAFSRVNRSFDRLESEGLDFMKKVRDGFLKLCENEKERMRFIDGSREIEVIKLDIQNHVKQFLSGQKL